MVRSSEAALRIDAIIAKFLTRNLLVQLPAEQEAVSMVVKVVEGSDTGLRIDAIIANCLIRHLLVQAPARDEAVSQVVGCRGLDCGQLNRRLFCSSA